MVQTLPCPSTICWPAAVMLEQIGEAPPVEVDDEVPAPAELDAPDEVPALVPGCVVLPVVARPDELEVLTAVPDEIEVVGPAPWPVVADVEEVEEVDVGAELQPSRLTAAIRMQRRMSISVRMCG